MAPQKRNVFRALAVCLASITMAGSALAQPVNLSVVAGEWRRPDGNYTLRVQDVGSDGSVNVSYFNPGKIHVAESRIDTNGGLVRLFVKLQDKGYPGSTYTLYYYAERDALAGFYFQAAMGQTFEVVFLRRGGP